MEQISLFSKEVMHSMLSLPPDPTDAHADTGCGIPHHSLYARLSYTGKYQMPVVRATRALIPERIRALYRIARRATSLFVPHFFTSDSHFETLWTRWNESLYILRRYKAVIAPDFSIHCELPLSNRQWNIYRNKALAAWWQLCGIEVIPNVSWIYGQDYALSFDGWPGHSMIAVNSTGVGTSRRCRNMWRNGYEAMLDALAPTHILRYGAKIEGEREDISTYYPNDNQIEARHGRE